MHAERNNMIILFGQISLLIALVFSLLQGILPLIGYRFTNPYLLSFARPSAFGQFFFIAIAYLLLTIAFGINDFTIAYVAANSHPALPLMYKLTATWGAHEGSILLWIFLLNIWTLIFAITQKNNSSISLILAILGIVSFSFICFLLLTSNPFLPAAPGQMPNDLNPLLQDPGFVIHPPMLYTGYVGFSVAFAITMGSLIRGQLDEKWAFITRRFAVAAWCFLTLGITLGSWWAYRVLGWGGFWFWDPVENASLLPWLSGIALIHVLLLVEKRGIAYSWAALLSIISFTLSLLGTFLVRSGVLISAHTFANDPARGVFLLLLLGFLITAALIIYVTRISSAASGLCKQDKTLFSFFSREMGLLFNSGLFFIAMITILLGTLYPLILDALHLGMISVGAPYFNIVMTPLVLVAMAVMGLATLCPWQNNSPNQDDHKKDIHGKELWKEVSKKIVLSILAAIALLFGVTEHLDFLALLSLLLSFWIILNVSGSLRTLPAMSFAHTGFAILIIGIMLSSLLKTEKEVRIHPGDATNIGPYQFFFLDTQVVNGENYRGIRATFDVIKNKRHITTLYPEKRIYTVRNMIMTKVDIHPGLFRDLYIALGEPLEGNYWSLRIYYKPFIRWIWLGGFIMMIGGLFAITSRRKQTPHPSS
jgi:cytochrome c-type biogenesis protein CcmF